MAGQPVGDKRKRFTAVALDGSFRVSAVAPLLNKLIKMRNDAGASDLGIGVVSMLGFSGTRKALQVRLAHCALLGIGLSFWDGMHSCNS